MPAQAANTFRVAAKGSNRTLKPSFLLSGAVTYDPANHIISHLQRLVFDIVKHFDIRRIIPLQAERCLMLRHFTVAVQHVFPFRLVPVAVDRRQKSGDFICVFVPSFPRIICLIDFAVFRRVDEVCRNEQMLCEKFLEPVSRFHAVYRSEQLCKIPRILKQSICNRLQVARICRCAYDEEARPVYMLFP